MKTILVLLMALCATNCVAQSIQVVPITKTSYCVGDTLLLSYTTTGTFQPDNIFIAQLSGVNDTFKTFTNIGTATATSNSFKIRLTSIGSPYLFRVVSTNPPVASESMGSGLTVTPIPSPVLYAERVPPTFATNTMSPIIGLVGTPVRVFDFAKEAVGARFAWRFGQDASKAISSSDSTILTYSSTGTKYDTLTVIIPSGCDSMKSMLYEFASCNPVIPKGARVVSGSEGGSYPNVWVKPGGNYFATGKGIRQNIFVESGGSLAAAGMEFGVVYLKRGASFSASSVDQPSAGTTILEQGATMSLDQIFHIDTFYCNNLQFDTSQVHSGVRTQSSNFIFSQQNNAIQLEGLEGETNSITISNLLGREVLALRQLHTSSATLSTRSLPSGVYFVRIEASNGTMTKRFEIVR